MHGLPLRKGSLGSTSTSLWQIEDQRHRHHNYLTATFKVGCRESRWNPWWWWWWWWWWWLLLFMIHGRGSDDFWWYCNLTRDAWRCILFIWHRYSAWRASCLIGIMSPSVMGNAQALDVLLNNVDSLELKKLVPSPSPLLWSSSAIQTDNQDFNSKSSLERR